MNKFILAILLSSMTHQALADGSTNPTGSKFDSCQITTVDWVQKNARYQEYMNVGWVDYTWKQYKVVGKVFYRSPAGPMMTDTKELWTGTALYEQNDSVKFEVAKSNLKGLVEQHICPLDYYEGTK